MTLDRSIDPSLDHFVYQPRKSPVNAQDIPFFLSTRLVDERGAAVDDDDDDAGLDASPNDVNITSGSTSQEDGTKKRPNSSMNNEEEDGRKHVARKRKRADGMNAAAVLRNYEALTASFANSFEERIVRF